MVNVAINGFGRIGRLIVRALIAEKSRGQKADLHLVSINDLGGAKLAAHLLKYDSTHGILASDVSYGEDWIDFGLGKVKLTAERNPAALNHAEFGVDVVQECTGIFTSKHKASAHLTAGAKKVVISAPAKQVDATVVFGVNQSVLTADMTVISNASCTTNCLAPVATVLHDIAGIKSGNMTTIHAYTGDQRILDTAHSDFRRARSAGGNMIPTSTGAAEAMGLVIPSLAGKLKGSAVRVPVPNVSFVDFTVVVENTVSVEDINTAMKQASEGALKGILGYCDAPLVSGDFNGSPFSSVFDVSQTCVMQENLVRIGVWYDNETGFSNRMNDTTEFFAKV